VPQKKIVFGVIEPGIDDPKLRAELPKGMEHNTSGEIIQPSDALRVPGLCPRCSWLEYQVGSVLAPTDEAIPVYPFRHDSHA
jgi:hypothetical protein